MEMKYSGQKWAGTIDRPYYPSIEYFTSKDDADRHAEKVLKEQNEDDGSYASTVCVVEIVSGREIKTHY